MRILAIRGSNLASLAGSFAVELERDPLDRAGLFAITGPTGAGKSTLLDALCVALFDKTPRLHARGGVLIGRRDEDEALRLSANDVRSLLRRGAGSGYAEVDFAGRDGHRYRARWSVRRARNRADGRFQPQEVAFHDLDTGEQLGGTKSETLLAIEAKLGLSFDQFRRSALLAQGDFAAFLRANGGQRAELLERMTGTEIYGMVSAAAFRRHADERTRLQGLLEAIDRHGVLSDEERNALDGEVSAAERGVASAVQALRACENAVAWYSRRDKLEAALIEARARCGSAEQAWADSEGARLELDGVIAASEQRAVVEVWDRAARALAEAQVDCQGAVARAGELGARASEGAASVQRLGTELDRARAQLWAQLRHRMTKLEGAAAEARGWLERNHEAGALSQQWARCESAFERLERAELEHRRLRDVQRELFEAARNARDAEQGAAAECKKGREAVGKAKREAARLGRLAVESSLDRVRAEYDAALAERDALRELVRSAEEAARQTAVRDASSARRKVLLERAHQADLRREQLGAELVAASARAKEAERTLHQMRLAQDLGTHRGELVDGEPCPLCGSAEHPWAEDASPVDHLVAEQTARLGELRDGAEALSEERAASFEEARATRREAEAAGAESDDAARALTEATRQWRRLLTELGELPLLHDPADARSAKWMHRRLLGAEQKLQELRAAELESKKAADAATQAADRVTIKQSDLEQLEEARRQTEHARREAEASLHKCEAELEAAEAGGEQARAELVEVFVEAGIDIEDALEESSAIRDTWASLVQQWRLHDKHIDDCERELGALGVELEAVGKLLGGCVDIPVGERKPAQLRAFIERCEVELGAAREAAAAAAEAAVRAEARAASAKKELDTRAADHDRAFALVREAAEAHGISVEALRQRLTRDAEWIDHRKQRVAALKAELDNWRSVAIERQENLAAHQNDEPPTISAEEARASLAEHAAIEEAARERLAELVRQRHADDDARRHRGTLAAQIDEQTRRADLYKAISDLIGSADGKKFRVFAQSLTLDALLAHANHHLAELADRYRLQRVPGHDLDLQVVDRDLGDEVRSVNSLSGGESFLVSLALALGLSSLSAKDTRVESLLIDEGFGSLDPATLEIALSVLDALQASGRKVGLISHVPGLAERIGVRVRVVPQGGGRSAVTVSER